VEQLKNLGYIYTVNGYPDMAIPVYKDATEPSSGGCGTVYPALRHLYTVEPYQGGPGVKDGMEKRFIPTPELTDFLDIFNQKIQLKNLVLDDYKKQLEAESDNLELRKLIADTDFWNGNMTGA